MVSTVESGQQVEQAMNDIEKQQSDIQDLHSYLQAIASIPSNEEEFMEELSLTGTAAEKLQGDIKSILGVYSTMRDQCETFQSDAFMKIIDLATKVKLYAEKAAVEHPRLHDNIKSLIDDRNNPGKLLIIRYQVACEKKELDEGIATANECRQEIARFQTQTAKHAVSLERKVRVQDNKQRKREEGELIDRVISIRSKAEVFMTCDTLGEKIWQRFVGLVPKSFREEEMYRAALEEIMELAEKEEFVDQCLWLYRDLIIDSLRMLKARVEAAENMIGSFRGIFHIFKGDIELAAQILGKYDSEDPVICNAAQVFFKSDVDVLERLSQCASHFIRNASS